jgi:hypothetical protein
MEISRSLTEDQSRKLKSQIFQIIRDQSEDASDLIDYVLAMFVNGKNVDYIVNELKDMEMDFCGPQVSEEIGRIVVQFLRNVRDDSGRDPPAGGETRNNRSGGDGRGGGGEGIQENSKIVSLKKVNPTNNALTMSGALGTKPSKGNALTMSRALGASRQGGRVVSGKDRSSTTDKSSKEENTRRDHGGTRGRLEDMPSRSGSRGGGNRSMASEAFKRMGQHVDRDRGGRGSAGSGGRFMDRRMEETRGGRGRGRGHDRDRDRVGNRGGRVDNEGGLGARGSGPGRGGGGDRIRERDAHHGSGRGDYRGRDRDGNWNGGRVEKMSSPQAWGRKEQISTDRGRGRDREGGKFYNSGRGREQLTSPRMQDRMEQGPSKRARTEQKDSSQQPTDVDNKDLMSTTDQNQDQQQEGQEQQEYDQDQYDYGQEQYGYGQDQYAYGQEQYAYYDWNNWNDGSYYYDPYYNPYYWGGHSSGGYYSGRGRGRGRGGRGGRGRGGTEEKSETVPEDKQLDTSEEQPENGSTVVDTTVTNDPSTLAAAQASPSPLVAAQFGTKLSYSGGRGFRGGRGRGRGRGRGTWTRGGGTVAAKLAAMSWSRSKNTEENQGEENSQATDEKTS